MKKIAACMIAVAALLFAAASAEIITITPDSGFYEDDITLTVEYPEGDQAWYSLDGTKQGGIPLDGEIIIDHTGDFSAHTVRVWTDSGYEAEAAYVLGEGIDERFDMHVGVIDTDSASLYDYDTGILVEGRVWDEYDEENPDNTLTAGKHPANYNQRGDEWVRDAFVTVFDSCGEELISQAVGLSVMGAGSSKHPQKSLKVSADESYDPDHDDFITDIFVRTGDDGRAARTITEFNNLVFRNSGNDYNITWFRWNFISELAGRAGFHVVQPATPCVLFLNGEYYGMAQLQPTVSRKFLGDCVGIADQENIQVLKDGDRAVYEEAGIRDLITADFSDPASIEALNEVMDVDQFIRYCAFQIICGNTDWPSGNVFMWRYTGKSDPDNPFTDGRWRFVLYDLDFSFDVYNKDEDIFEKLMLNDDPVRAFFRNLMQSDELRGKYLADTWQLLSEVFVEDDMLMLIDALDAQVAREITELSPIETVRSRDHGKYVMRLREETAGRRTVMDEKLREHFACEVGYALKVTDPGSTGSVEVNGTKVIAGAEGIHYAGVNTIISCNMHEGWEFESWTVNGATITDREFAVTDEMAASGSVEISLNAVQVSCRPIIRAVAAKDEDDLVEIYNPGSERIMLGGLYLSDDREEPGKVKLPDIFLDPGKSITVAAHDGDYPLNFGIKTGETLIISEDSGEVLDAVTVPKMEKGDIYARYDGGEFAFYRADAVR